MQETRAFYVRDDQRVWATLTYSAGTKEFHLSIEKDATWRDAPFCIAAFVQKGMFEVGPEWALRWVKQRLIPPERANIGEILRSCGLTKYDEFGMLVAYNGRCVQDDLYIEEML